MEPFITLRYHVHLSSGFIFVDLLCLDGDRPESARPGSRTRFTQNLIHRTTWQWSPDPLYSHNLALVLWDVSNTLNIQSAIANLSYAISDNL